MAVYVREFVASPELGLVPLNSMATSGDQDPVTWVSTTELDDPSQFLRGGEVVLTTGVHHESAAQREEFVARLASVPISGLGFATGLVHKSVPPEVTAAADAAGLALFEVPLSTPFIAISRWFADRLFEEKYDLIRQITFAQKELTSALVNDLGLTSLVRKLREILGAPVAVIDVHGQVLASHPARRKWPAITELRSIAIEQADHELPGAEPLTSAAVEIEGVVVAYLCAATSPERSPVIPFAISLIGLELARRQAVLTGNREMLGQVLEDIISEHLPPSEAVRRLALHGLDVDSSFRVLIGRVDCSTVRLRRVPWNVLDLTGEHSSEQFAALIGEAVVVISPEDRDPAESSTALFEALSQLGPNAAVGVSGVHRGVHGLRIGHFEAGTAVARGPGRHGQTSVEPLTLAGLLLSNSTVPVRDIAMHTLAPLIDYDNSRNGDLIKTLKVYLETDCSPSRAARLLFIHRNGMQYRLERIAELTGRNLASFDDRAHLWLALSAMEMP
ncbi:PucR family transcriptional regulator [Rhodococcus sp. NPDC057529]|uniref:PucR family transcriptional regulator n=1 Tax=Rhodococcus sp. NPDC057529 TaxID=3346158 RepID=UPI0036718C69